MARVKLSEYKAKSLLCSFLGGNYQGLKITQGTASSQINKLDSSKRYILKVDNGIKGRMKKGLIFPDISKHEISKHVTSLVKKGFRQFLLEEFIPHETSSEKFIAFDRQREGILAFYSNKGGIDIENGGKSIRSEIIGADLAKISSLLELEKSYVSSLLEFFDQNYISFLESNPFLSEKGKPVFLDLAVEVDSAAEFFQNAWSSSDFVNGKGRLTKEEEFVQKLNEQSPASLRLEILNPNGSIFTLLSGGGASLVIADEIYNQGLGHEIANYSEYSGNPSDEEAYLLTKNVLSLILKSKPNPKMKKKLLIAGGVANFTDIRVTFRGIIKALDEFKSQLTKEGVKVYVRRGGPHQEEGLSMMRQFLKKTGLLAVVAGPEMILTDIVNAKLK